MLSIFPNLLTFSLLAPLILRLVVGLIFIDLGYLKLTKEKTVWKMFFETVHIKPTSVFVTIFALVELVGGVFLVLGFLTQLVALIFAIILFAEMFIEHRDNQLIKRDIVFYGLLLTICLSLLLLGPGVFAIDLPL
jgi:putative oxidoreductase